MDKTVFSLRRSSVVFRRIASSSSVKGTRWELLPRNTQPGRSIAALKLATRTNINAVSHSVPTK